MNRRRLPAIVRRDSISPEFLLTAYIVVFDINPTDAVQPETSSSYLGSAFVVR